MSTASRNNPPLVLNAALVGRAHTYLAYTAFATALSIGCLCHYKKIVRNGVAGYPEEWFPSVSATIGDWYPERSIFQILIAITSGPRLALVSLQYFLHRSKNSSLPTIVFVCGLVRTLSCGGWVYITSNDDHDAHDVLMITYMICNIPWMLGGITCTSVNQKAVRRKRILIAMAFFISLIPLVYFFIRHKVHRIPGAYTRYSFFEWGLIFFDVLYDSVSEQEFKEAGLQVTLGSSLDGRATKEQIEVSKPGTKQNAKIMNMIGATSSAGTEKFQAVPYGDIQRSATLPAPERWRSSLSFLSDVYLSYVFWSIFTSLIPTLFYFSVWELGIAGQELALFATLSPLFLSIPSLLSFARTQEGGATLHLLSFTGLGAYLLDKPLHRLFAVTFSTAVLVLGRVAEWTGGEGLEAGYRGVVTGLGLLVHSLSKHANHSNNPVWPFVRDNSGVSHKVGITLALLAVYEVYTRTGHLNSKSPLQREGHNTPPRPHTFPTPTNHWLTAALPLGGLLFSLHNLVSDSSTLITWSWTGYENGLPKGPVPHLHGALTLIAQSLGLFIPIMLSSHSTVPNINVLAHPIWFVYGTVSAFVVYRHRDWAGYVGGLNLALFLMSITPLVFHRAAAAALGGTGKIGRVYFTALLVYCLLNLASIFTVAYAFVPGGIYFRERTDLILAAQILSLSFILYPTSSCSATFSRPTSSHSSKSKTLLVVISVLSLLTTLYRWPSPPQPFKPGPRIVNAGIWTVHFGIDNEGRDSQNGVKNLLRDMQLDIVGLLETDLHRTSFGHRDLTRVIVEEMGYYVDLGPGPNSHTWGAVLLSKFPIINSTHHLLPSPRGELAPAIEAVLDIYGMEVTVVVAHNGQEEDPLDRELQSTELARIMAKTYPRPVIFLGYVVTHPMASRPAPYEIMVTDGRVHDIDQDDTDRWCEYIFYRGLYRTSYARLSRGVITDTEMQIGQFVLPKHNTGVINETQEARYLRSSKENLPMEHWFPMAYYGHDGQGGVNGHYYHVFGTPLYYQIPEGAIV